MIIYLSGAISSRLDSYKQHFQKEYDRLTEMGHQVLSPHFLPIGLRSYDDYMNIAKEMIKAADAIYLLEGWEWSEGSQKELKWAMNWNMSILEEGKEFSESYLSGFKDKRISIRKLSNTQKI